MIVGPRFEFISSTCCRGSILECCSICGTLSSAVVSRLESIFKGCGEDSVSRFCSISNIFKVRMRSNSEGRLKAIYASHEGVVDRRVLYRLRKIQSVEARLRMNANTVSLNG